MWNGGVERRPAAPDVVVASNLFSDILTDGGAAIRGRASTRDFAAAVVGTL